MSSPSPTVAFSLATPLAQAAADARRRPGAVLGPVLVLLLPLLPLVAGIELVLRGGGSGALQGLIAGSPPNRPGALILRPDTSGWLLLAGLAALLAVALAVILAAGLATGAAAARHATLASGAAHRDPAEVPAPPATAGAALRGTLAVWPALLVVLVGQVLLVAVAGALIGGLARLSNGVQFQLSAIVLTFGLGWLLIACLRCSLWPAIAIADGRPTVAAVQRSWTLTHGSVARLAAAAFTAFLAVVIPTVLLHAAIKTILTLLAGQELIGLSPLAIDLWALLPAPFAVFLPRGR